MFLLDDLIFKPLVTLPVRGLLFIVESIASYVEQELNDEGAVQKRLLQLRQLYELGEVSEEEYRSAEKPLLEQLHAIRERRLEEREETEEENEEAEEEGEAEEDPEGESDE